MRANVVAWSVSTSTPTSARSAHTAAHTGLQVQILQSDKDCKQTKVTHMQAILQVHDSVTITFLSQPMVHDSSGQVPPKLLSYISGRKGPENVHQLTCQCLPSQVNSQYSKQHKKLDCKVQDYLCIVAKHVDGRTRSTKGTGRGEEGCSFCGADRGKPPEASRVCK